MIEIDAPTLEAITAQAEKEFAAWFDEGRSLDALAAIVFGDLAFAKARADALERRLASIKSFADSYAGTWRVGHFARDAIVTHGGGLWAALEDTDSRPGESSAWKLIVKGGRAA